MLHSKHSARLELSPMSALGRQSPSIVWPGDHRPSTFKHTDTYVGCPFRVFSGSLEKLIWNKSLGLSSASSDLRVFQQNRPWTVISYSTVERQL